MYFKIMRFNRGYSYREELDRRALGHTVLSYLARRYRHSSPQEWKARLARGEVWLDGAVAGGGEPLRPGQTLVWHRPPWEEEPAPRHYGIVYQDEAILAVNKPSGLPTVPAGGFLHNTLLSLVRERFPGANPVHRLGRGTSGLVLFALEGAAASRLGRAWAGREVEKTYRALASGAAAQDRYAIDAPIGPVPHPRLGTVYAANPTGKPSHSVAWVLERRPEATVFAVRILTGRPHQIRIHLATLGHPLVGDPLYGAGGQPLPGLPGLPGDGGYWLHAERLVFPHPVSGEELVLEAPVPPELATGAVATPP